MIKPAFLVLLLCATHSIFSQESLSASGGEAAGSGGTLSYSVGQVFYTSNSGGNGTISQGVQQSIELFTLSNPEFTGLTLNLSTYPNPTTDYIILRLKDSYLKDLSYVVYDIQGKKILKGLVLEETTQINMQYLEMGTYILKVNQSSKELKSFKIIKN